MNRDAPRTTAAGFEPRTFRDQRESLLMPSLEWLAGLTEREFREAFRGSAMKRTKWSGLVRNACIALGNATIEEGTPTFARTVRLLERLAANENPTIAESARWALSRIERRPAPGGV